MTSGRRKSVKRTSPRRAVAEQADREKERERRSDQQGVQEQAPESAEEGRPARQAAEEYRRLIDGDGR